jgi:hypothetical protein
MKPVQRNEIVDYLTYEEGRDAFRARVMAAKAPRRVHIGAYLTLLFENRLTVQYQVQEMMRAEKIVREKDIQHELDTYNELLGGAGELGCTLLVEIEDAAERAQKLSAWLGLPERIYLLLEDGSRAWARVDDRQNDIGKISSVQFLKFATGPSVPVAAGVEHPELQAESNMSDEQRQALAEDLAPAG